jgi:hypothetical protein
VSLNRGGYELFNRNPLGAVLIDGNSLKSLACWNDKEVSWA